MAHWTRDNRRKVPRGAVRHLLDGATDFRRSNHGAKSRAPFRAVSWSQVQEQGDRAVECSTCGYAVEWLRSCYRSKWFLPETGAGVPIKGRYYFSAPGAPFYPDFHNFTSRNWTTSDAERDAPYGEQPGKQTWDNGSWPVRFPDPKIVGSAACIADGQEDPPAANGIVNALLHNITLGPYSFAQSTRQLVDGSWFTILMGSNVYVNQLDATRAAALPPYSQFTRWEDYVGFQFFPGPYIVIPVGFYIYVGIQSAARPPSTHNCFGVPAACWTDPPACWEATGGTAETGHANTGYAWTAAGGSKESGAATITQGAAWTAAGGSKESGAAATSQSFAWTAAGGSKESGAAATSQGFAWTAAGGQKEGGAAGTSAAAFLYAQSVNTDVTCDIVGETSRDLATAVGTGSATSAPSLATSFTEVLIFDIGYTAVSGTWSSSLNVASLTGTGATGRYRVQVVNGACAVVSNSAYSATFTTTGVKTLSAAVTVPAGGNRVRIAVEYKKNAGGLPGGIGVTCDASSYVQVEK